MNSSLLTNYSSSSNKSFANCISLEYVLETFNSSISEEQAWAICFCFIKCIQKLTRKGFKFKCKSNQKTTNNNSNVSDFHIYLHKDGYVHEKTIFQQLNQSDELNNHDLNGLNNSSFINNSNGINNEQNGTKNALSNGKEESDDSNRLMNATTEEFNEKELLMRLGLALFDALDYNKDSNEELLISSDLENLIAKITLEEVDGKIAYTVEEIYDICCSRKASQNEDETDEFYASICKTLVIETIELSTFLQTIYEGTQIREKMFYQNSNKQDCTDSLELMNKNEPLKLHLAQWAKLWMQVLDEFRNGKRKLKKVETKTHNSVSSLDRVNAHNLIMEYIRSRPALVPANNRKLGPLKPPPQSLIEQIHESIRKQDVKLKSVHLNPRNTLFAPIVGRVVDRDKLDKIECSSESNSPIVRRKLIRADIDFLDWDDSDFNQIRYSSAF